MTYQHLRSERQGSVEHLTLNRPEVRNAFNEAMIAELTAWANALGVSDARVVVISGAGKAFSAGADVAWMAKTVAYSEAENLEDARHAAAMFAALDQLPVPVVGRLHGAAIGGGAGLAAVCDIVVASNETTFAFSEVKLGIVPAVISPYVIAKIGRSAARELFLTGARFTATRAREIGLVHAVVPLADLDTAVSGYVDELLTAGPEAIATAKALVARVPRETPENAATLTARAIANRRVSEEGQEGLRAFLEKRKPGWSPP